MYKNEEPLKQATCLFLDHDDTLIPLAPVLATKLDGLCALSGKEVTDILLREIHDGRIHTEFRDRHSDIALHTILLLNRLGLPCDQQLTDKVTGRIKEAFKECIQNPVFFQDSLSFLDGVKECGFKLYLTTVNLAQEKVKGLEKSGSRKYFVDGYDEATLHQRKLDPAFYKEALNRSGALPYECVCIGDSVLDDVIPPKSLDIQTVWLNRNGDNEGRHIADFEVSNLTEALILLENFSGNGYSWRNLK